DRQPAVRAVRARRSGGVAAREAVRTREEQARARRELVADRTVRADRQRAGGDPLAVARAWARARERQVHRGAHDISSAHPAACRGSERLEEQGCCATTARLSASVLNSDAPSEFRVCAPGWVALGANDVDWQALWLSVRLAAIVATILLVVSLPLAHWLTFSR